MSVFYNFKKDGHKQTMKDKNKEEKGEFKKIISRINPERRFMSLRDAVSRLFDESFLDSHFDNFHDFSLPSLARKIYPAFPKVDISETDSEIIITANIPGIDPDKINIEANENMLILNGRIEKEEEEKNKKFYKYEREEGEFRRELSLPSPVKSDEVKAKIKDGVLTIILPKTEETRKKRINIEKE